MRIEETIVNILFDAGKGSTPVESREGVCGQPFGELPQPTRAGYRFVGWYLGDAPISAETVLQSESDVRLSARWEKKEKGERRASVMRRQRLAAIGLAVAIVFLSVALALANNLIAIYHLDDTYVAANGELQTDRYTIKRENGAYKLFNRDGDKMELVEESSYTSQVDGIRYEVYIAAASGNQYLINTETGEYETYAVVDYDASQGESLGGTVKIKRVMMFPRVGSENIYSITVKNSEGSYRFYRKNVENTEANATTKYTTTMHIEGTEESLATYDPTLFSSLCVSCGYTLTKQKLDLTDPATPRNPDGSVRLEDYGLVDCYDENGELVFSPATYTLVTAVYAADGSCSAGESYTVTIGRQILSKNGYYAMLEGRDAIYIMSSDIGNTILQPIEKLVSPATLYPMSASTFVMVYNFRLGEFEKFDSSVDDEDNIRLIAAFDYIDLARRENTIYVSTPYWLSQEVTQMNGYMFSNESVSTVLGNLYEMQYLRCCMLGPKEDADFEKYGLLENVYMLTFDYDPMVAQGGSEEKDWVENTLLISSLTEDGTYFVYSYLYDMIVEVDQYYLSFLEWQPSKWYERFFFRNDISYVHNLSITKGETTYEFDFDNRFTYSFYDNGNGTGTLVDLTKGTLSQAADGTYYYTVTKTGAKHTVLFMDLTAGRTYRDTTSGKIVYRSETGIVVEVPDGTRNLHIYCPQYEGENGSHRVDYTIEDTQQTDTGATKTKTYTVADNFRRLYGHLLTACMMGDVSEADLGMSVKEYIKNNEPTMTIRYSLEDKASILNPEYYTENHKAYGVIRFYQYTERKMLLTIEMLDDPNATPNPLDAQGSFHVLSDYVLDLMDLSEDFLNGTLLPSVN